MKLKLQINEVIKDAFAKAGIEQEPIPVSEATRAEFGDYQFNGAMALAKVLNKNPRDIAAKIMNHLSFSSILSKAEIAGSGFINLWINPSWLGENCQNALKDERLKVARRKESQIVVVDYSGPNMAKQMHVGHIRSTIIGDALANLLSFLGDKVIRQNHIGDWGTQFGMLVAYLEMKDEDGTLSLENLEQFYKDAKAEFDINTYFAGIAREYVVKIQSGDEHCLKLWKKFIDISLSHCEEVYEKLNVNLKHTDVRAESFYNDDLPQVIVDLGKAGQLQESDGAKCVFTKGDETPVIVQKGDGGYLYATTDLAALRYRVKVLGAQRIMYVVDARQAGHFKQIFDVARDANFVTKDTILEHIGFGMMMNESGKPFKTRDGGTIKLVDLLNEAIEKAKTSIKNKDDYSKKEIESLAKVIGIAAVKYADLSTGRESNYIFNLEKMLSFDGNTALYIQYAYARIQSIFKKHNAEVKGDIVIMGDLEHRLATMLLRFEDTLYYAADNASPNYITNYLYELATLFMRFYEQNPILKEGVDEATKMSRLQLADLTAKTIKQGLDILGIQLVNRL